jgi:hypothetical protein
LLILIVAINLALAWLVFILAERSEHFLGVTGRIVLTRLLASSWQRSPCNSSWTGSSQSYARSDLATGGRAVRLRFRTPIPATERPAQHGLDLFLRKRLLQCRPTAPVLRETGIAVARRERKRHPALRERGGDGKGIFAAEVHIEQPDVDGTGGIINDLQGPAHARSGPYHRTAKVTDHVLQEHCDQCLVLDEEYPHP